MSTLSRAIVLAALVASPMAEALTLGPLVVHSHLGQPFRASIAVQGAHGPVRVHMAPRAAFRAAGMKPPGRHTAYRCRVAGQSGDQRIVVTSGAPVEHPGVTLLLVVDSPHGSRVQEYHTTLRPVLFPTMRVQSGLEPTMMPSAGRVLGAPPGSPSPAPARSPYHVIGPIHPGESLLGAARAMDPGHHDMGPLMEALVHTNPGAFVDANANGLRVGAVLHRPSPSLVRAISSARALRFLRAQYAAWVRLHTPRPTVTPHSAPPHAAAHPVTVVRPAALTPRPLANTPPITSHPQPHRVPARAVRTEPMASIAALSLAGVAQAPTRPIPEAARRAPRAAGPLSAAALAVTGVTGHTVSVSPPSPTAPRAPTPSAPVAPAPAVAAHGLIGGIPAHQLADLVILIIAVLGIRQFLRQRQTGSWSFRGPLARLFARPAGDATPTPPAPAAPATPVAPAPTSAEPARIPSYETSAAPAPEPPRPADPPARAPSSTGSSLIVAVAHRDDQILRLDLARTYVDLGEIAVARDILTQVRASLEAAHKPALDDHSDG
jgi:pilus assembly protein FimV